MLLKSRISEFVNKVYESKAGLWFPEIDVLVPKFQNILFVLDGDLGKRLHAVHNIVTNDGDVYYAERMANESPTNTFANLYLSTVDWDSGHPAKTSNSDNIASVISGSSKAVDGTYPQTNDADADNTGAGTDVVTWRFSYAKGDFSDNDIDAGAIAEASVTSWGSASLNDPLLTAFDITPAFAKTSNDTLKVFVNHTANGV